MNELPEVWLRGNKTPGITPMLQPAVDALLQAGEEINKRLENFSEGNLWVPVSGLAAVGFHLKHIVGFLDRLLTYAEGKSLTEKQLAYLKKENVDEGTSLAALLRALSAAVDKTIERYKQFAEATLIEPRKVGRAGLPSTVVGLCFHAAEHTARHTGQLLVTAVVLNGNK